MVLTEKWVIIYEISIWQFLIVSSSGSNSVWVERSNSTCGIRIEERDDQELVGAWTVMAEVGGSREQDRIIRSTVAIPRRKEAIHHVTFDPLSKGEIKDTVQGGPSGRGTQFVDIKLKVLPYTQYGL